MEEATEAGYSWCISTNLLFVLGHTVLVECRGFPPLKTCVLGGLWGSNAVPTLLTGQVHDCMIRAAQGVLPLLTGESVPVETIICKSLGCDESQNYVLKEFETLQSKVFCTCSMFITLQVCLLLLFFFFLFFGWANSREHWSRLNGLEEV